MSLSLICFQISSLVSLELPLCQQDLLFTVWTEVVSKHCACVPTDLYLGDKCERTQSSAVDNTALTFAFYLGKDSFSSRDLHGI